MSQKAANLVLQTTPGTLESIVDRKINLGVALVGIRLVPNIGNSSAHRISRNGTATILGMPHFLLNKRKQASL
jgi:hypothetical protein